MSAAPDIEDMAKWPTGAVPTMRGDLLRWYDAGHRSLPWRHEEPAEAGVDGAARRAYAVWVSEIMLQQTQVERVKEYYRRWMARWPTVADLAGASLDDVREAWQGLGYYRRARFLLEGAQQIVGERGGALPSSAAEWRQIKGVGEYTAGAISSIAFGCHEAAVDGNVIRVFTRLRAIGADATAPPVTKALWRLARALPSPSIHTCHSCPLFVRSHQLFTPSRRASWSTPAGPATSTRR